MKRLLLAGLALALSACVFAVPRASALPRGCDSWGKLPVTVAMDDGADEYRPDVQRAMDAWSEAMHQPAFAWSSIADADVLVAVGETDGPRIRGEAYASCKEGRVLSAIVLQQAMDVSMSTAFATHELGHALGLGHSTNDQSIMHATIDVGLMGRWDDDHQPGWYRILPSDARLAAALHASVAQAGTEAVDAGVASGIGTSPSVSKVDPESDPGGAVSAVLEAAKGGQWRLLAGLLLTLLVWAARRWGSSAVPWLKTDRGGAALVLALALLGGVATTLLGDAPFAWGLLVNSVSMAFTAAGGYAVVRKLLAPSDKAVG